MKKASKMLALLLALAMAASMAACGSSDGASAETTAAAEAAETEAAAEEGAETEAPAEEAEEPAAEEADAGEAAGEKVFKFATGTEPTSMDQSKGNSIADNEVQRALQEGLVRLINGEVQPGLAESWEVSEDGLTYTFHIRDGLLWSDGEPLTVDDIVYGFKRLVDPETASPYGWIAGSDASHILNADAVLAGEMSVDELGVAKVDDSTMTITVDTPVPYLLSLLGSCTEYSPVRADYVEQYGTDFAATAEKNVYSGPFVLTSSENQELHYAKNPNYWNADAVNFDEVVQYIVSDDSTRVAMFDSGDVDYVAIPNEQVPLYEGQDQSYQNGNDDYLYINSASETQPLLQDANFRLALNYGLSRTEYISLATNDIYDPGCTFVLPMLSGVNGGTYGEEYGDKLSAFPVDGDVAKAQEYLKAAGVEDPSSVTVELVITDAESEKLIGEVIQQQWQTNLGINVEIRQVTYSEKYGTVLPSGDYELAYGGWGPDYDDPNTYLALFNGNSPYNYSNYKNEEFDALMAAATTEQDVVARMDMLAQAENILLEDGAMVPLQYRTVHYLMNENVTGINFTVGAVNFDWPFGDIAQ